MADETITVVYNGPAARAGAFAQMIEEQGARVSYEPPIEYKDARVNAVRVVFEVAGDTTLVWQAAKLATRQFREWFPGADVEIQGDDPDDGDDG